MAHLVEHVAYMGSRKRCGVRNNNAVGALLLRDTYPCSTVSTTLSHPPGPVFHGRYLRSWSTAVVSVPKKVGAGNFFDDSFPKTCRSVLAPSWLSSNRPWKIAPGVCDCVIYPVVCATRRGCRSQTAACSRRLRWSSGGKRRNCRLLIRSYSRVRVLPPTDLFLVRKLTADKKKKTIP